MQDLSSDIIGTNPKYPPLVNHDWLRPQAYDNYPSDNNPVRIGPKLADLWSHNQAAQPTGISLVPNLTVQDTRMRAAEESDVVTPVVCEAKKAMMAGLKGRELADHLRARFAADHILKAKETLAKLSEEQGLLGNVYIDASAFTSSKEAEQFLTTHRTRLAQDIVINESKLNPSVISVLASRFHKNVVASINYDENLFQKYHGHLQAAGRISRNFVINSKETLRQAFLAEPSREVPVVTAKEEKKPAQDLVAKDLQARSDKAANDKRLASEEMLFRKAKPIIEFASQQLSKGKAGSDLKEMLRKKYAKEDLNESAKYLGLVIKEASPELIDQLVEAGRISEYIGGEMKKLAKKYPVKHATYEQPERAQSTVIKGFFYPLSRKNAMSNSEAVKATVELLRKGAEVDALKTSLAEKLSAEEVDGVLAAAVQEFNQAPAGMKANVAVKATKEKVVADFEEKPTLPDRSTIKAKTEEITSFFEGADLGIDVDAAAEFKPVEVKGMFNRDGLDSGL